VFAGLLGKVVPLDVNGNTDFVGGALTINILPVPRGHFFDASNKITAIPLIEREPLAPGVVRPWSKPK